MLQGSLLKEIHYHDKTNNDFANYITHNARYVFVRSADYYIIEFLYYSFPSINKITPTNYCTYRLFTHHKMKSRAVCRLQRHLCCPIQCYTLHHTVHQCTPPLSLWPAGYLLKNW